MTQLIDLATPSFPVLRQQIEEGARTGTLLLDLAALAPELVPPLQDLLRVAQVRLDAVKAEVADAEVRVVGTWKLPAISLPFLVEARFRPAGAGIGCRFAIAPVRNPLDAIGGDLARAARLLPIKPSDFWITLSTTEERAAHIGIEGHEVANALIARGAGYLMRFDGQLLRLLSLQQTVFSLAAGLDTPAFRANLDARLRIGELLELDLEQLAFAGKNQLSITGTGILRLFGATLTCKGDLALGLQSMGFSTDVDPVVKLLDRAFFRGFSLKRSRATLNGTLTAYSVGVAGDFVIAGSNHTGAYEAQYAAGNTTPFPDLFQLNASRLTPSDALTVMSGIVVGLPRAIDRLVVLENVHLYYSTRDGLATRSGVPSRQGAAMHGDVVLLGYRGYVEAQAFGDAYRLRLLLDPINVGGILEISGSGEATPAAYNGTKVKAGGILLEVDTQQKQVAGSLKVRFLKQVSAGVRADLRDDALAFEVDASFTKPLGKLKFASVLVHEQVRMTAGIDIQVGVSDFGVRIPRLAGVKGSVAVAANAKSSTTRVDATIHLGPLSLPLSLTLDATELEELASAIEKAVEREVSKALADAAKWLMVALEGLLKSGVQQIEQGLSEIGAEFQKRFKCTGEETARLLKQAGYAMEQALWVLSDNPIKDLMKTFGTAGAYTVSEIAAGFAKLCNQAKPEYLAREVGHLLNAGGLRAEELANVVAGLAKDTQRAAEALVQIGRPVREVAKFLFDAKKTVVQAAEIIGGAFGDLEKETLKQSLKLVGYAEKEVAKVVDNLWREGGRFVKNLHDEMKRAWDRYTPSIRIVLRF